VTLGLGGDYLAAVAMLRAQPELCGPVACDQVTSRLVSGLAADAPRAIRAARTAARERAWALVGDAAPGGDGSLIAVDLDATIVTPHSEKENAAPTWKKTSGSIRWPRPPTTARSRLPRPRRAPPAAAHRRDLALSHPAHHRDHPPARLRTRLTSTNRPCDQKGNHRARGTPLTRRDSRAASHGQTLEPVNSRHLSQPVQDRETSRLTARPSPGFRK
jgi:hypothetical protein